MRVGILGTGAISQKHAAAYKNIGYRVVACNNRTPAKGRRFAEQHGCAPSANGTFAPLHCLVSMRTFNLNCKRKAFKFKFLYKPQANTPMPSKSVSRIDASKYCAELALALG